MRLSTNYMGLELKNPLVPSASPLTEKLDKIKILEDNGASAVVLFSLFEEQIEQEDSTIEHFMDYGTDSYAESLSFFPQAHEYLSGPQDYLENLRKIKEGVDIPIIASLNGATPGGWMQYAKKIQEAGADGLELNIHYLPVDFNESSADVEKRYTDIVSWVKSNVDIPVAVKIGSRFSSLPAMAKALEGVGADALVMFNRFYHPDIDLEKLETKRQIHLSHSRDIRLPMRWISILRGNVNMNFAASGGVHSAKDVLKLVMSGADVTMLTSGLMAYGPELIKTIEADLITWMDENEYQSISQMKGSMSLIHSPKPQTLVRDNYMRTLLDFQANNKF
ncbi:MAG: dihydroorotate dehydrogenase-like protein [FCB group bacterium]|nr:dihydroorotate dehydrogenase-like protein [FCB group bacterium]MBL7029037.1 dihydroorotate dehydrogenase-like protein [Candidatus Neomarinimicrobiota bacterium]MBL7121510.1 dihydroorotate dehydrogenase-like protein [Candidatus Neomarinimicrobiota bacterium]